MRRSPQQNIRLLWRPSVNTPTSLKGRHPIQLPLRPDLQQTIPSQPSAETAAQSSLTENQISMLAHMDKPMADRMRAVFQNNNTHGTTSALQQIHNPQQQDPPLNNPIQDTASTSRLQGLTGEEIRNAIADTKEENQSRINQHMAQILKKE